MEIIQGDSLEKLKDIQSESVDCMVTDPPYGYSFMGKSWDKTLPDIGIFKECHRVLKPGAFAFVMSAPRSDVCARMMLMLEDAGFQIGFTPIYWTYASGFPKASNIGKMVDKRMGVEREVTGTRKSAGGRSGGNNDFGVALASIPKTVDITVPATSEAKALDGSYGGFQPKPAVEVVIVAMKPLSEKTFVDQALKNGKGITWLDDVRIPGEERDNTPMGNPDNSYGGFVGKNPTTTDSRFPANLLVSDDILNDHSRFFSLDSWAQNLPFLQVPKASKREKNEGLVGLVAQKQGTKSKHERNFSDDFREFGDGVSSGHKNLQPQKNFHPTVKPLTLMSYLITLGSRTGDTILDPFLGSGTTAIAAKQLGRECIGIEREEEYVKIAEARIQAASLQDNLFATLFLKSNP